MKIWRLIALLVTFAVFATACSATDSAEQLVEPEGDLVSEVEGFGAVHSGEAPNFPNLTVEAAEPPLILPAGLLVVAPGLRIEENTAVTDTVEIRLPLPDEPNEDAIPGALRVLDDGSSQFVPGLWDPNTNEVIVQADAFSDWFGGWWNPLNWIEEAVDFAADWITGRTDPPECQNNGPFWSLPQTVELSSVHVCHQTNLSETGEERAEVFLRSNRRTAQLIEIPDDPAYRWDGDGFDLVQRFLVEHVAGMDPSNTVWLGGAEEMSLGFSRPEDTATVELTSTLTTPVVLTNLIVAMLGLSESEVVGVGLAVIDCVDNISSEINLELELPTLDELADLTLAVFECMVSLIESSEFIQGAIVELFDGSGIPNSQLQPLIDRASMTFRRLGPLVKRVSAVLAVAEAGIFAFDLAADSSAQARLDWQLRGIVPSNIERPTFIGQVEVTDAGPVHLLMDVSGSMGDFSDSGTEKIESAKAAVADFIQSLDADRPLGLRTYPDGPSTCNNGIERIPVGNVDRTDVTAEVFGLDATGDTPTAEALRAAAADLANFPSATIVLISDGESTCEPPCQVAEELVATGFDVTVLTAGISIAPLGREELTCVANVTGGFYTDLETVEDLNDFFIGVATVALSVELDFEPSVVAESAGDSRGATEVRATVTNVGQETLAQNVVARFGFDELGPAVISPVRSLGNVAPGQDVEVSWSFRAGRSLIDESLGFTIFAGADNSDVEFAADGAIQIEGATSLEDAGELLQSRENIVILGDSYSAGEGAHVYFAITDDFDDTDDTNGNRCHRSPHTYLFELFELPAENLRACSGAVINDFFKPNEKNEVPSQVTQLANLQQDGPVDAVAMSIGGNDVEFSNLAIQCLDPRHNCAQSIQASGVEGEGLSVAEFLSAKFDPVEDDPENSFSNRLQRTYAHVNAELNSADAVDERDGVAPIIVLSYPRIVPFTNQGCSRTYADLIERSLLSFEELVVINTFISRLNAEIEIAVDLANANGVPVYFVPTVEDAFNPDHTICSQDAFANTFETAPAPLVARFFQEVLDLGGDSDDFFDSLGRDAGRAFERSRVELFHPNQAGYQAMTEAVLRWSNSDEARQAVSELEQFEIGEMPPPNLACDVGGPSQILTPESPTVADRNVIRVAAEGFGPLETVTVGVASTYQTMGTSLADIDGSIDILASLPLGLEPGAHTVTLEGFTANGEWHIVRFPIEVPDESRLVGYLLSGLFGVSLLGYLMSRRRTKHLAPINESIALQAA